MGAMPILSPLAKRVTNPMTLHQGIVHRVALRGAFHLEHQKARRVVCRGCSKWLHFPSPQTQRSRAG